MITHHHHTTHHYSYSYSSARSHPPYVSFVYNWIVMSQSQTEPRLLVIYTIISGDLGPGLVIQLTVRTDEVEVILMRGDHWLQSLFILQIKPACPALD